MKSQQDNDWDDLSGLWQSQEAGKPDLSRLRKESARGRRREIALSVLEVATFALAAWFVLDLIRGGISMAATVVVLASLVIAAAIGGWSIWNRRCQFGRDDLPPAALVERECNRAQSARRFWRVNTRMMLGLVTAAAALGLARELGWFPGPPLALWWAPAVGTIPFVAFSVIWARRRDAQLRSRLDALEALRHQLSD